jgi:hypothetical protein
MGEFTRKIQQHCQKSYYRVHCRNFAIGTINKRISNNLIFYLL